MTKKNAKTEKPRLLRGAEGMTMVEVVVAFAVLLLVLALANTAVHTSLNLSNMAEDVRQRTEAALGGYYAEATSRAASETTRDFGDFDLPVYAGAYTHADTGYSFYWFHDGKDHTPPEEPEDPEDPNGKPNWLPLGKDNNKLKTWSDNKYENWNKWWAAVVKAGYASAWNALVGDGEMSDDLKQYVYDNNGTITPKSTQP